MKAIMEGNAIITFLLALIFAYHVLTLANGLHASREYQ